MLADLLFPPALVLLLGVVLVPIAGKSFRLPIYLVLPLTALGMIWGAASGATVFGGFLGYQVQWVEIDNLRRLFASTFLVMTLLAGVFAYRQARTVELAAAMGYAAGAVGVSLAGDLIAMFLFWELMVVFSTLLIWSGGSDEARKAGIRYGILQLIAGIVLKIGIEAIKAETGSVAIQALSLHSLGTWLLLIGLLVNAAAAPLSVWLTDAYPKASPLASVFLSLFTTKTAILALLLLFPGQPLLLWLGLYMMFYGIVYGLLTQDIRRIMAFGLISQLGLMLCGVGIGTEAALNAVALHAVGHILFIGLLYMASAVVILQTGKCLTGELGGLWRTMPVTATCGVVAAVCLLAVPLSAGFIGFSSLIQVVGATSVVGILLSVGVAGSVFHVGFKLPWLLFFQATNQHQPQEAGHSLEAKDPPLNMRAALIILAGLCILLGLWPQLIQPLLPFSVELNAYSGLAVFRHLLLLAVTIGLFFLLLPRLRRWHLTLPDTDLLYRHGLLAVGWLMRTIDQLFHQWSAALVLTPGRKLLSYWSRYHGPNGLMSRTWPTGSVVLWVAVLLIAVLLGARVLSF